MSKLHYPNNGIYKYCSDNLETCSKNLSTAASNCTFDIPSGFGYTSYLNGLYSDINKYIKEINSINSKLQKTNNNFETLETDLTNDLKKLTGIKIKERDRMIV